MPEMLFNMRLDISKKFLNTPTLQVRIMGLNQIKDTIKEKQENFEAATQKFKQITNRLQLRHNRNISIHQPGLLQNNYSQNDAGPQTTAILEPNNYPVQGRWPPHDASHNLAPCNANVVNNSPNAHAVHAGHDVQVDDDIDNPNDDNLSTTNADNNSTHSSSSGMPLESDHNNDRDSNDNYGENNVDSWDQECGSQSSGDREDQAAYSQSMQLLKSANSYTSSITSWLIGHHILETLLSPEYLHPELTKR